VPGRVFISCGQATASERDVARRIESWFHERNFNPYVAIQVQSLADINSGIVDELKSSDFYIFIDCRRERLVPTEGLINPLRAYPYRGSLFTNQELAIVFLLRFENVIFLRQEGVELNGLMRYMGSNATVFSDLEDVPRLVAEHALARNWQASFTRHLALGETRWSDHLMYRDQTGQRVVRVFYVDIHNHRDDIGAVNAIARLQRVMPETELHLDRSPLKTTGQPGYSQVIWPLSHAAWDFLAVDIDQPGYVFLNSALDSVPRNPVISKPGHYTLSYEVFAENFPVLRFQVNLAVASNPDNTTASLGSAV